MSDTKNQKTRRMADSMAQAASMLGCSVPDLKRAKAAGCDGFKGSRVDIDAVTEWLATNPVTDDSGSKAALERRRLLAQCRRLELQLDVERGKLIPIEEVWSDAIAAGNTVRGIMQQLVNHDIPSWAGLDSAGLHAKAQEWYRDRLSTLENPSKYKKP